MENKTEKIVSLIRVKGPVVPSQISTEIGCDQILTSAMLSELVSSKTLYLSRLKVGSSPLYFLPEQKYSLENFIDNMLPKEKEAFLMLKEKLVLDDSKLEPAIRVALRNIKDFAVPLQVSQNNQEKIFWRFYSFSTEEATSKIKELVGAEPASATPKAVEKPIQAVKQPEPISAKKLERLRQEEAEKEKIRNEVIAYAKASNIEITGELKPGKDGFYFKTLVESSLGKLEYLLVYSIKGILGSKDITSASKKGRLLKMPVLLLSKGQPNKSAERNIISLKGQLMFKNLPP